MKQTKIHVEFKVLIKAEWNVVKTYLWFQERFSFQILESDPDNWYDPNRPKNWISMKIQPILGDIEFFRFSSVSK